MSDVVPGKIARVLVDHVESVDAVDFSKEMIRVRQVAHSTVITQICSGLMVLLRK